MSWSTEALIGKAQLYVERGLDAKDDALKAWWFHFAVEPMLRAMVATIHPVLLADPRSVEALLAAAGDKESESAVVRARGMKELIELALRLDSFSPELKVAASRLVVRRNAECHGASAAFEDLEEEEWMPDFLMLASAFCEECDLELVDFVGAGYAETATELVEKTVAEAEAEVAKLIATAKKRPVGDGEVPEWTMAEMTSGEVRWRVKCPACEKQGLMSGGRVHVAEARFDGDELSRQVTVAGRHFDCPHCQLELQGTAQLVAAGLKATTTTYDWLDPYEALGLDPVEEASSRGHYIVDPDEGNPYEDE
jgi:hypothetical protein